MHGLLKIRGHLLHPLGSMLLLQQIKGGQCGSASHGVGRIGIPVWKLNVVVGAATGHEGVVNLGTGHHAPHGHGGIGDLFGEIEQVWHHTKSLRARPFP